MFSEASASHSVHRRGMDIDADLGGSAQPPYAAPSMEIDPPRQTPLEVDPTFLPPLETDPRVVTFSGGHCSSQCASYWNAFLLPPANVVCEGYVFTPVCQSFCSQGGVCLSACWDTPLLGSRHPPGADSPPGSKPRGADTPPQEQILPCAVHAGRCG